MLKDFFIHFFGQGDQPEFAIFTIAHLIPILLLMVAIFLMYRYRDILKQSRYEMNFRYILAFALIIVGGSCLWSPMSTNLLVVASSPMSCGSRICDASSTRVSWNCLAAKSSGREEAVLTVLTKMRVDAMSVRTSSRVRSGAVWRASVWGA